MNVSIQNLLEHPVSTSIWPNTLFIYFSSPRFWANCTSIKRLVKTKESFNKISSEHQKRLTNEGYLDYVEKIEKCIDSNYNIIKQILGKAFIEF